MGFPGIKGPPEQAIAASPPHQRGAEPPSTFLGASVFGVAANRPTRSPRTSRGPPARRLRLAAGLPVALVAGRVRGPPNPKAEPYHIVHARSRLPAAGRGTGARVVRGCRTSRSASTTAPRRSGGEIQAARDLGIQEYLLWDPAVRTRPPRWSTGCEAGGTFAKPEPRLTFD